MNSDRPHLVQMVSDQKGTTRRSIHRCRCLDTHLRTDVVAMEKTFVNLLALVTGRKGLGVTNDQFLPMPHTASLEAPVGPLAHHAPM